MQHKISYENGKISISISDQADWDLFERIFEKIKEDFTIKLVNKIDGIDERYWDFEINGGLVCLHLQHYLGISIFPVNDPSINEDVKKIAEHLIEKLTTF